MRKKFSIKWRASKKARKQRKYRANAPLHIRQKLMSSNLSKELRKKLDRRSTELRKNCMVKIMRGKFKGKTGKVGKVDLKRERISIEGIQRQKKDGTKINVYFHPSKVQIIELSEEGKVKKISAEKEKNKEKEENAPEKK